MLFIIKYFNNSDNCFSCDNQYNIFREIKLNVTKEKNGFKKN